MNTSPDNARKTGRMIRASIGTLLSLTLLATSTPSIAAEPVNNSIPLPTSVADIYGNMEVLVNSFGSPSNAGFAASIASSTDVDYILLVCAPTRRISKVLMNFLSADLDITLISTTAGRAVLGSSSFGGTSDETINVGGTISSAVLKVVGYQGAISNYNIALTCS